MLRIFQRCFAASRLPICYSKGFHPHPRISLGPPLKTGWEGLEEYMDIYLEENLSGIGERMNRTLPEGLRILKAVPVDEGVPKLTADIRTARYAVEVAKDEVARRCKIKMESMSLQNGALTESAEFRSGNGFLRALEEAMRERFGAGVERDVSGEPVLLELTTLEDGEHVIFEYLCTMPSGKSLRPEDLLSPFMGRLEELTIPPKVVRKALYVERKSAYLSPIDKGVVQRSS